MQFESEAENEFDQMLNYENSESQQKLINDEFIYNTYSDGEIYSKNERGRKFFTF